MTTTNSNPLSVTALSDYDGPTMNKNPMKVTIVGGGGGDGGEPIAVAKDGVDITDTLSTLDFIGDNIEVTDAGSGHIQVSVESSGGGGGGTPGGDDTQVQFNNSGSFGGIDTLTYDGTDIGLSGDVSIIPGDKVNIGIGTLADAGVQGVATLTIDGSLGSETNDSQAPSISLVSMSKDFSQFSTMALNNGTAFFSFGGPTARMTATTINHTAYTSSRDDSGTTTPVNFLYTDGDGNILSAPKSMIVPTPPSSGTYTLQSVNGVMSWISA